MQIEPLGDRALLMILDDAAPRTAAVAEAIRAARLPGVLDVVPAFDRIAVHLLTEIPANEASPLRDESEPGRVACATQLRSIAESVVAFSRKEMKTVDLPTVYDGPDLRDLAAALKISPDELMARHSGATYTVLAVGFTPGFAYLGGLPPELHAPRRATPRPRVEPGSVAIGGPYTGVYPSPTPGGWHLIGRTDALLFDLTRDQPSLLRVGDTVRFVPHIDVRRSTSIQNANTEHRTPNVERRKKSAVTVLSPGTHTTIQDLGRPGHRAAGVPVGGAVDRQAHLVANWLVGNDANAATTECALVGPRLRFARAATVAICGARVADLPYARPFRVGRGETLNLERLERGVYAYLAIAGGFDAPIVLGSRATDARLGIGRPSQAGDRLAVANTMPTVTFRDGWRAGVDAWYDAEQPIRFIRGGDAIDLPHATFTVSARSNRMGVRLAATSPLVAPDHATRQSVPVTVGTIQVPPDGDAIVLLADAQTIGGYAVAGHVIAVDLPRLAQRRPGEIVRFAEVSLDEADVLSRQRRRELAWMQQAIGFVVA